MKDPFYLDDKKILIAGAGISGRGAAMLLGRTMYDAAIYDGNVELNTRDLIDMMPETMELTFELGPWKDELADKYDILILSPGIPMTSPIVVSFQSRGKDVWGEIELAYYFASGKLAAITGTNGKTTTTALVGEIFKEYFLDVHVVGNIGIPYTSVACDMKKDTATVAEISSFQLESIKTFRPDVSAILNLTPDHLDRHKTMECYGDTKLAISKNQTREQVIILNDDDPLTRAMAEKTPARAVMFSRLHELEEGIFLRDDTFIVKEKGREMPVCTIAEIKLLGTHNYENILAAIGISYYMGVPIEKIRKGAMGFTAVEHRIEFVRNVNDVDYYNDSKGTNPDAAIKGIQAMIRPTVLIGGGYDKKLAFDEWIEAFDGKVRYLILMGVTARQIGETAMAHGFKDIIYVTSLEEAVRKASELAQPGDAVLLSPACASWDMFASYEQRGRIFKDLVGAL